MLTGWKTLIFGLALAVGPQALDFLAAVNWASVGISPNAASLIGFAVIALRAATKTPLGVAKLLVPAFVVLSLTACSTAQLDTARAYQDKIAAACKVAMPLAPLAGPLAIWIEGGCATDAAIAKLALDPFSLEWVDSLIAKAKA